MEPLDELTTTALVGCFESGGSLRVAYAAAGGGLGSMGARLIEAEGLDAARYAVGVVADAWRFAGGTQYTECDGYVRRYAKVSDMVNAGREHDVDYLYLCPIDGAWIFWETRCAGPLWTSITAVLGKREPLPEVSAARDPMRPVLLDGDLGQGDE